VFPVGKLRRALRACLREPSCGPRAGGSFSKRSAIYPQQPTHTAWRLNEGEFTKRAPRKFGLPVCRAVCRSVVLNGGSPLLMQPWRGFLGTLDRWRAGL